MKNLFDDIEDLVGDVVGNVKSRFSFSKNNFKGFPAGGSQEDYILWGKEYVAKLKNNSLSQKVTASKENFLSLLRLLGVNEALLIETFNANKKELLDPLFGELVAILALVLGWKNQDKEEFSKALGEIGVIGLLSVKPFVCLIAICGLAWGYERAFHQEAFKKGGFIGLTGMTAAFLAPGAFTGILATLVVVIYLNKKISVDRPVETQVKEIFAQIKNGQLIKEIRESWKKFEAFLSELFRSDEKNQESTLSLESETTA